MSYIPNFPVKVHVSAVLPKHSDKRVITRAIREAITEICKSRACDGTLEIETAKHLCERQSDTVRIDFFYRNRQMEISLDAIDDKPDAPARERVEKMRGEWRLVPNGVGGKQYMCSRCGGAEYEYWRRHFAHGNEKFCPDCGAPMTDEAVDMMLERVRNIWVSE